MDHTRMQLQIIALILLFIGDSLIDLVALALWHRESSSIFFNIGLTCIIVSSFCQFLYGFFGPTKTMLEYGRTSYPLIPPLNEHITATAFNSNTPTTLNSANLLDPRREPLVTIPSRSDNTSSKPSPSPIETPEHTQSSMIDPPQSNHHQPSQTCWATLSCSSASSSWSMNDFNQDDERKLLHSHTTDPSNIYISFKKSQSFVHRFCRLNSWKCYIISFCISLQLGPFVYGMINIIHCQGLFHGCFSDILFLHAGLQSVFFGAFHVVYLFVGMNGGMKKWTDLEMVLSGLGMIFSLMTMTFGLSVFEHTRIRPIYAHIHSMFDTTMRHFVVLFVDFGLRFLPLAFAWSLGRWNNVAWICVYVLLSIDFVIFCLYWWFFDLLAREHHQYPYDMFEYTIVNPFVTLFDIEPVFAWMCRNIHFLIIVMTCQISVLGCIIFRPHLSHDERDKRKLYQKFLMIENGIHYLMAFILLNIVMFTSSSIAYPYVYVIIYFVIMMIQLKVIHWSRKSPVFILEEEWMSKTRRLQWVLNKRYLIWVRIGGGVGTTEKYGTPEEDELLRENVNVATDSDVSGTLHHHMSLTQEMDSILTQSANLSEVFVPNAHEQTGELTVEKVGGRKMERIKTSSTKTLSLGFGATTVDVVEEEGDDVVIVDPKVVAPRDRIHSAITALGRVVETAGEEQDRRKSTATPPPSSAPPMIATTSLFDELELESEPVSEIRAANESAGELVDKRVLVNLRLSDQLFDEESISLNMDAESMDTKEELGHLRISVVEEESDEKSFGLKEMVASQSLPPMSVVREGMEDLERAASAPPSPKKREAGSRSVSRSGKGGRRTPKSPKTPTGGKGSNLFSRASGLKKEGVVSPNERSSLLDVSPTIFGTALVKNASTESV